MKTIAVVTAALLAVIGIAVGVMSAVWAPAPVSHLSRLAQEIDQFAVDMAAGVGNPTPARVTWVTTTATAGADFLNGAAHPSSGGPPVYVLEVEGGTFTWVGSHDMEENPTGPVLYLELTQGAWDVQGMGVGSPGLAPIGLRQLGTPETDSLAGLKPMTELQWLVKFVP